MPLPDVTALPYDKRLKAANRIRATRDYANWPDLRYFNSAPCPAHAPELNTLCRKCGIKLRRHQRIGAAWMYFGVPGMLGDTVGSGKTAQVCAVLAMCKETGELGPHNRAVIVCKAVSVHDPWRNEIKRLLPDIPVFVADGTRDQRVRGYMGGWEVVIVSDRTFAGASGKKGGREGDVALLEDFPVGMLFYDDIDPLRNSKTQAARAINRLAAQCSRVNGAHATPLQKGKLSELWSQLEPLGGELRLGSLERVKSRYVTSQTKWIVTRDPRDKTGRRKIRKKIFVDNGITSDPRLRQEFRNAVRPLVLRRTAAQMDDVELPGVVYDPQFIALNPRQRTRYDELRAGTLRRLKEDREEVTTISKEEAARAFMYGWQICSGLAALDDGLDDSAKLDWAMDRITGDLAEENEKVVVFIYFKNNVAAMRDRLREAEIGHVLMWGAENNKKERQRRLEAFREDPGTRVLVGSPAIETSLNLQVARQLMLLDTILNPARMDQIIGRVRRVGSPYPTVYVHHLMAADTQEEAYLAMLRREAEVADVVWDESQSTFTSLSPRQLLRLVATGKL